jgi:hypothetical protein
MSKALNEIPAEDFDPLLGQELACRADDTMLALQLEQVWRSPYPTGRALPGFSLFLRGPLQPALGQGMLQLSHPQLGELALFMTPVGRDAQGMRYEIVFN